MMSRASPAEALCPEEVAVALKHADDVVVIDLLHHQHGSTGCSADLSQHAHASEQAWLRM